MPAKYTEKSPEKYVDLGCSVCSSCINCPLDKCLEEISMWQQTMRLKQRAQEMLDMRKQGMTNPEISRRTLYSVRTIYRVFERLKKNIK
jgi:DNA-binding NarL/FixJ family response regulator